MLSSTFLALALYAATCVNAQGQTHNLTPDGYWHNRYHALLSMAAYGDYENTCPQQTFTEASKLKNFPDSTRAPFTVINTFGPTPSGCEGFTAIIPEMNKALIIFKGDYVKEQQLNDTYVGWDAIGLDSYCESCTVNAYAAQGYMECKAETNNWQAIRDSYYNTGLVFSITGHGLGGMHSQIASVDLNTQNIAYYSHAYGNPRVFNQAGANFYNYYFNGEAGERGISQNDQYTEWIPAGDNYAHAGTPFKYYGYNSSTTGMNWEICWTASNNGPIYDDPDCMPSQYGNSSPLEDHYYYFTPVTQCGSPNYQDTQLIDTVTSPWVSQSNAVVASASESVAAASSASVASVLASSSSMEAAAEASQSAALAAARQNESSGASQLSLSILSLLSVGIFAFAL